MPSDTAEPAALPKGQRVGHYALQAVAGRGAASTVYLARDLHTGQAVALKLTTATVDTEQLRARDNEARAAQALAHPHIIQLLDMGQDRGRHWFALEWVAGYDLSRYTLERWRLPDPVIVDIALAMARAIDHAHRQGITHRDIKPGNLRVNLPAGIIKLGDFGMAGLHDATATATGVIKGTPAYMAPEVLAGGAAGPHSDLYAFGAVVFELLASRRPHEAQSLGHLLRQVVTEPAISLRRLRPDVAEPLQALVDQLLQRDTRDRPADMAEVIGRLAELSQGMGQP